MEYTKAPTKVITVRDGDRVVWEEYAGRYYWVPLYSLEMVFTMKDDSYILCTIHEENEYNYNLIIELVLKNDIESLSKIFKKISKTFTPEAKYEDALSLAFYNPVKGVQIAILTHK